MALSDFYQTHPHYKTRLLLHHMDSNEDVVQAAASVGKTSKRYKFN
ncbi:hypothetical protein CCACVL1_09761 [Corchorus capsularis]|uniref:Uncharacterized protein n=1 Tax=Corchorus capsularis TaxID=210143 RepID=A0A1R3IUH6_COCAP|nr:hypothetical protein CCACVL1_09761 [Corchorus capsularis]